MVDPNLVEKLRKAMNLTLYEAKLYIALLQGASNPKEASVLSGVPLPRIYDVVRVLESKGLVVQDPKGWFKPLSPRAVATAVIAKIEEESRKKTALILEVSGDLEEIAYKKREHIGATLIKSTYGIISTTVDTMRDADRIYLTITETLAKHKNIIKSIIEALAPLTGDIRIITSTNIDTEAIEIHIEAGIVKIKKNENIIIDTIASKKNAIIIAEDPIDKNPIALFIEGGARKNNLYERLEKLWNKPVQN